MKKFLTLYKSKFCSLLWFILGLEALVVIYLLTPAPLEPLIVLEPNFATLTGDNVLTEEDTPASFTVSVSKNLDKALTVSLAYGGTAVRGVDYNAPDTVVIEEGDMNTSFVLTALDDNELEGEEIISVKITAIDGKNFMEPLRPQDLGGVVFTKMYDESKPQRKQHQASLLSLNCDNSLVETNATATCTIMSAQKAFEPIQIGLKFSGQAAFGEDYVSDQNIVLPAGENKVTFKVTAIDDAYKEGVETIEISLDSLEGGGFEEMKGQHRVATIRLMDEKSSSAPTTLSINNIEKIEEGGSGKYTLTLSREPHSDVTVTIKRNKSATKFNVPEKIVFHKGETSKAFNIDTVDDNIREKTDFIDFAIAKVKQESFERLTYANNAVKTKVVDEALPTEPDSETAYLTLSTESGVTSLSEDVGNVKIVVTSSQAVQKDTKVTLRLNNAPPDGRAFDLGKTVTIKKGESNGSSLLRVANNNIKQTNGDINISIVKHNDGGLEDLRSAPPLVLTISDEKIQEKADVVSLACPKRLYENSKKVTCTLSMSSVATQDVVSTINYAGSAVRGVDFNAPTLVTIAKGKKAVSFTLSSIDDIIKEGEESIEVSIGKLDQNYFEKLEVNDGSKSIALVDEKKPTKTVYMTLAVHKSVQEGQSTPMTLTLSEQAIKDVVVFLNIPESKDYTSVEKAVIAQGKTSVIFDVEIYNDNLVELKEYLPVRIDKIIQDGFEKLSFDKRQHRVAIVDDNGKDEAAHFTLSSDTTELYEDDKPVKIKLTLSQPVEQNMRIVVNRAGTATDKRDYSMTTTLVMKKGEQSVDLPIKLINDNRIEDVETIVVSVNAIQNGGLEVIEAGDAMTLHLHDDRDPTNSPVAKVSLNGPSKVSEPDLSKPYTVKIDQRTNDEMIVTLAYAGSADSSDYNAVTNVSIPKGTDSATFSVQTLDDNKTEDLEEFTVSIAKVEGGGLENVVIEPGVVKTALSDEIDIAKEFERIVSTQVIEFDLGSREINEESKKPLDEIAALLKRYTKAKLIIQGHTNALGNEAFNLRLSQDRAVNIKAYLIAHGVSKKRIRAIGYGSARPLLSVDHADALEFNKRVEFKVVY